MKHKDKGKDGGCSMYESSPNFKKLKAHGIAGKPSGNSVSKDQSRSPMGGKSKMKGY